MGVEGGTEILAATTLRTGVEIQVIFPTEIGDLRGAVLLQRLIGEVDRLHSLLARKSLQKGVRTGGQNVKMLRARNVHRKAEHDKHVDPLEEDPRVDVGFRGELQTAQYSGDGFRDWHRILMTWVESQDIECVHQENRDHQRAGEDQDDRSVFRLAQAFRANNVTAVSSESNGY